jgi:hypothetical protein
MRTLARARLAALAILAAVAGMAAVGLAALAEAGVHVCGHRLASAHEPTVAICPTVLYASAVAAGLCLLALVVMTGSRAGAPAVLTAAARLVAGLRVGPLTGLIGCAGAVPVLAILASEGVPDGPVALLVLAALIVGAFLTALSLAGTARFVLAMAEGLVVALARAFRLLVPGADTPCAPHHGPILVGSGIRLAYRRPSRAPPLRS